MASPTFCGASAAEVLPITRGKISHVQIGMLGPFEVRTDDGVLADVPGTRLRGLLAALTLRDGSRGPEGDAHRLDVG